MSQHGSEAADKMVRGLPDDDMLKEWFFFVPLVTSSSILCPTMVESM